MAILSRLSSVRIRLLTKQLITHLIDSSPLAYDKLHKFASSSRVVLDDSALKAVINTIYFIVSNATRYDIDPNILYPELEQLGLPSDVAKSLSKIYLAYQAQLTTTFQSKTLKLNSLSQIQWRINYILDNSVQHHAQSQQNQQSSTDSTATPTQSPSQPLIEARIILDLKNSAPDLAFTKKSTNNDNSDKINQQIIFDASMQSIDLLLSELKECQTIFNQLQPTSVE
jgi:hypothetical protein